MFLLLQQYQDDDSSLIPKITSEESQEKFEEKMKEITLKEREKITASQADNLGFSYIDLSGFPISPETLGIISEEEAERLKVICFLYTGEEIRIGSMAPQKPEIAELLKRLEAKYHTHGRIYAISEHSFGMAKKLYASIPHIRQVAKGVNITEEELERYKEELKTFENLDEKIKEVSLTEIVSMIVASAIQAGASDIHIEAEEIGIKVRFRLDGVLQDVANMSVNTWPRVISRIKLLSGLKLNIEDRPQDGRFTISLTKEKIDVRVSTLPTSFGESVVMRLLMSSTIGLKFEDLGIKGRAYEQLKEEIERPNGMIITTGPTGSGKTTTLYAILNKINTPKTKIITIEDPVEYKLSGISQSQADVSKDYTFAKGLRSIVRQDPDVIMVGEIRDLETAEIAIQAALTGHLVLSTIHTNDAAGTIPRFLSMGAKPFLLAPALNAMIGQRLVRKICENCKEEIHLDPDTLEKIKESLEGLPKNEKLKIDFNNMKFYEGKGCDKCNNMKYKGRVGIFEIMVMDKEIEKIILSEKVSEYMMREVGIKNGMITMVQDGLLKALEGITSVEEVFRVAE